MNEPIRSEDLFLAYVPTVHIMIWLLFVCVHPSCFWSEQSILLHYISAWFVFFFQVVRDIIYANARQKMGDYLQTKYPQLATTTEVFFVGCTFVQCKYCWYRNWMLTHFLVLYHDCRVALFRCSSRSFLHALWVVLVTRYAFFVIDIMMFAVLDYLTWVMVLISIWCVFSFMII